MLIAIKQKDAQYLIDMDIMLFENKEIYDFTFSDFNISPVMLSCNVGE